MSFTAPGHSHLSYGQLEQLWIDAGGTKSLAPLMAAVALAESGGWAGATNPTDNNGTQTSWGLWQISDGTHHWSYSGDPYNPLDNAKAAVMKYHSQGLGAWGTYTSGAYQRYYQGNTPPETVPVSGSGSPGQGFSNGPQQNLPGVLDLIPGGSLVGDLTSIFSGGAGALPGVISSTLDGMKAIGKSMSVIADVFTAMLWLLNPAHQLRILSGLLGIVVLGIAIYYVASV